MAFNISKLWALKIYIVLCIFINVCDSATKKLESCEIYFADSEKILCIKQYGNNTSLYKSKFPILKATCNDSRIVNNTRGENARPLPEHITFVDCLLRPGVFKTLNFPPTNSFSSSTRNTNIILKNNTFHGICGATQIYLSNNGIEILEPGTFDCVNNITSLDLSKNRIEILTPDIFKDMSSLKILILDFNQLHTLPSGIFRNLLKLEDLRINSNFIFYLPKDIFNNLISLRNLMLDDNNLETLNHSLQGLTQLEFLNLKNNKLKRFESEFSPEQQVQSLNLENNTELVLLNESFKNLFHMRSLNVGECNIATLPNGLFIDTHKLSELSMPNNRIKIITPETFGKLKNLTMLYLSFNEISELTDGTFQNNTELNFLKLDGNNISEIKSEDFQGPLSLKMLDLGSNFISTIADGSFGLPELHTLNLSYNRLSSLHSDVSGSILSDLKMLQKLDLSNNMFINLSNIFYENQMVERLDLSRNPGLIVNKDTFVGLTKVKTLYLKECNITYLPDNTFNNISQVTHVSLAKNDIQKFGRQLFTPLKDMKILDMSFNKIAKLPYRPFENNVKLKMLFLIKNNLDQIVLCDFKGLNSLARLDMSSNVITKITCGAFDKLEKLSFLNVSHNRLPTLIGAMGSSKNLKEIDISHNILTGISNNQWEQILYLKRFKATNNKIEQIFIPKIAFDVKSPLIHLEWNKVRNIYLGFENEGNLTVSRRSGTRITFYLNGNPLELHCDCDAYKLYQYSSDNSSAAFIKFIDDLVCQQPPDLRGRKLNELKITDFTCNFLDVCSGTSCEDIDDCYVKCNCLYRLYDSSKIVKCSSNNLDKFPLQVPEDTNFLYIDHNKLTSLAALNESSWNNLTEIDAEGNEIISEEFYVPRNLKLLRLKNNKLKYLPVSIQKHAEEMEDFRLTLSKNLWPCNCSDSMISFKNFLSEFRTRVIDNDDVKCIYPNNTMSHKSLRTMSYYDLCPREESSKMSLAVYIVSAAIILVSATISALYYRHRVYVLSFLYTHCSCYMFFCCDKENEEDKLFDAFISYSSLDREVALAIIEHLEEQPPFYKFCIHERNWIPGHLIANNLIHSVQNSRKTLIVLSDAFLQSEWFLLEFQTAYQQTLQDKKDRIIFILKGNLPDKSELDEDVQYILSSKTYLEWGERWFWEKLRYAMHQQNAFIREKKGCSIIDVLNFLKRKDDMKKDKPKKTQNVPEDVELQEQV